MPAGFEELIHYPLIMIVGMKDVAERAGVSVSAVSLVLSGRRRHSISSETRTRILPIVDEMGYRPNQHARSLVLNNVNTVTYNFM